MEDILPGAGKTVVHAQYLEIFGNKAIAEVRAEETGAAGYQYAARIEILNF